MHPVTERFFLIERLDRLMLYGVLACFVLYAVGWYARKRRRWVGVLTDVLGWVMTAGIIYYAVWRTFFAWQGVYYP